MLLATKAIPQNEFTFSWASWDFCLIPLDPTQRQRPATVCKSGDSKRCVPFCWLKYSRIHFYVKFLQIFLNRFEVVSIKLLRRGMSTPNSVIIHILLFFTFPYCGLGRSVRCGLKEKSSQSQDLIAPPSLYIYICTLYTYTNICRPRFSQSGFFGTSKGLIPTPALTSEYPICAVRIHTHTLTYTPTRVKNGKDTDNTLIFPSFKKKTHAKQPVFS